jgi:hypothetical protein
MAANSHSKKKAAGEIVLQKKETSLVTDCPWFIKWSSGKTTQITGVNTQHNYPLDVASCVMSKKFKGWGGRTFYSERLITYSKCHLRSVMIPLL